MENAREVRNMEDLLDTEHIPGMRCAICGETIGNSEAAEMYDAANDRDRPGSDLDGIVHAECGIAAGWQVS